MSLSHRQRALPAALSVAIAAALLGSTCAVANAAGATSPEATAPGNVTSQAAPPASGSSQKAAVKAAGLASVDAAQDVSLSIKVSAPKDREAYQSGEIANYSVTATNDSDQVIPSLTLTGDPTGVAGKAKFTNGDPLGSVSETVTNLEPGESVTLTFRLTIMIDGDATPGTVLTVPFTAQASDAAGEPLGSPATGRSQIVVDPLGASIVTSLTSTGGAEVHRGDVLNYTATVSNLGDTTSKRIKLHADVTDLLDDAEVVAESVRHVGGIEVSHAGLNDDPTASIWVGKLGYLTPKARALVAGDPGADTLTVTFAVKVNASAPIGATLGANVSLSGNGAPAQACGDDCATLSTVVADKPVEPTETPTATPTATPSTTPTSSGGGTPSSSETEPTPSSTEAEPGASGSESATPTSGTGTSAPNPGASHGTDPGATPGTDGGLANTGSAGALLAAGAAGALGLGGVLAMSASKRRRHG